MNTEMMLKIADQIERDPEHFNYHEFATDCGTAFCIAGWAMVFDGWKFEVEDRGTYIRRTWVKGNEKKMPVGTDSVAQNILNLSKSQVHNLFFGDAFLERFNTPASEVADYMRSMVKEYENEH